MSRSGAASARAGIMVVPDADSAKAGVVTWWKLSGVVNYDQLVVEWNKRDLPMNELPGLPSENAALRHALDQYKAPNTLLRPLPTGGFAVVDEFFDDGDAAEVDPEYDVRFKVWIDMDELELRFDREMDDATVEGVLKRFLKTRREIDSAALSSWLSRRVARMSAVGLRETGGIYFIPETHAAAWSDFADLLASVSESRIYEIPAMRTERAVEAIMEAIIQETQEQVAAFTKAIHEDKLGVRALETKANRCDALAQKLRSYEQLLGVRLGEIHAQVQAVDARIADMILNAE